MRTDNVAFRSQAKQLALDGIANIFVAERIREQVVERIAQPHAWRQPIDWCLFATIRYPHVVDTRRSQLSPHGFRDAPASSTVGDPELSYVGIDMRKSIALGSQFVCKERGIEVQSQLMILGPLDPACEVLRRDSIAIDIGSAELAITCVQVNAMPAWY